MDKNRENIKRYKQVNTGEVGLPVCFDHASGVYIYDAENNKYLDFTSGYGVTSTGWLNEELNEAICVQLKTAAYAPPWLASKEAITLSELILSLVPKNLEYCARATGGADANEIIRKAIYAFNGKPKTLSFHRSYHGGTHFTLNLSEKTEFNLPATKADPDFIYTEPPSCSQCTHYKNNDCNLECTNNIEKLFQRDNTIGSFFAEPVLGSGGVIIPSARYWKKIRALCTQYKVVLVFDEVLTGFGRLGCITAAEYFGVAPDAISFAKGITNGYAALGVAVLNKELGEALKRSEDVSATFAWTPLSCAIATANINIIMRNQLADNARSKGRRLMIALKQIFSSYYHDKKAITRGIGLMIGIEINSDNYPYLPDISFTKKFIIRAMKNGLMVCASWDFQTIILMPPLCINDDELCEGISIIEKTVLEMKMSEKRILNAVS